MKRNCLIFLLLSFSVCLFCNPKVHFSIDDVSNSLYDLTKNEKKYSSAFEQPFFRYLKTLNDRYSIVVSLYCFYEHNGFTLADCTDKFSKDFSENSSWLKFGYHAWNPNTTFIIDQKDMIVGGGGYEIFLKEIERITGSTKSITSTVRLDRFKGNKDEILQSSYKFFDNGISTLLCADSKTRSSYFLSEIQEGNLNILENIQVDGLYFHETDFRFDDYKNFEKLFSENVDEKEMIVFTHEWLLYVPTRKNIIKYFEALRESKKIKSNIETFFLYCLEKKLMFVSEFQEL